VGRAFPPAALTVVFGLNALVVGAARDQYALGVSAIVAGNITDVLVHAFGRRAGARSPSASWALPHRRPTFALVFATLALTRPLVVAPAVVGSDRLAGGVGWLLSWLVAPPAIPAVELR
jgi:hypothetical protein